MEKKTPDVGLLTDNRVHRMNSSLVEPFRQALFMRVGQPESPVPGARSRVIVVIGPWNHGREIVPGGTTLFFVGSRPAFLASQKDLGGTTLNERQRVKGVVRAVAIHRSRRETSPR